MKIAVRPHQDFTVDEHVCFPGLYAFVFSLGLPSALAEDWTVVYEADVDQEGTISVFNMAVSIPESLCENTEWVFRFKCISKGCMTFEINGVSLGLSVDFVANPVIPEGLLKGVRCLCLKRLSDPKWVDRISRLDQLEGLHVSGCRLFQDFHALSGLLNLRTLIFRRNEEDVFDGDFYVPGADECEEGQLRDVNALSGLTNLRHIVIDGCGLLRGLRPLSTLMNLTDLSLHGCKVLNDLSALTELTALTRLSLDWSEPLEKNERIDQRSKDRKSVV